MEIQIPYRDANTYKETETYRVTETYRDTYGGTHAKRDLYT